MALNQKSLFDLVSVRTAKVNPHSFPEMQYISMADVESATGRIINETYGRQMRSSAAKFTKGDVLYGRLRPYLNKVVCAEFDGLSSAEFIVLIPSDEILPLYLAWRLRSDDFVNFANGLNAGDRPRVKFDQIASFILYCPSIEDQKKIIEVMEIQFTRLDAAIKSLKSIKTKLGLYRKSVLKAAFSNELIPLKGEWQQFKIKDIAKNIQYGLTSKSGKNYSGPRYLRITDIQDRKVNWEAVPFAKEIDDLDEYRLNKGDLVFARTGATVGKSFLIEECPQNAVFASYLIRIVPDLEKIDPALLWFYFQSPMYWHKISESQRGIGQPNVNGTILSNLNIDLPVSITAQRVLTQEIESRLSVIDKVEEVIDRNLTKTEVLRKTILKSAFEGKLVN